MHSWPGQADDFTLEFGFSPDYEYGANTDPAVPNLTTSGSFALANTGDEVILKDSEGTHVDSVVYEGGDTTTAGWFGPPIYPYGGTSVGIERFAQQERDVEAFGLEGQILYRKLDQATGLPVPDTNTAADWAQVTDDNINGKKVQYPGKDLEHSAVHLAPQGLKGRSRQTNTTLCDLCIESAGAIRASGDLVALVEDGLEGVQRAMVLFDSQAHVTDDLVQQGTYDHLLPMVWNDDNTTIGRPKGVVIPLTPNPLETGGLGHFGQIAVGE